MRLPRDCQSVDDVFKFLMSRLEPEDAFRLQQLIRDYDTEVLRYCLVMARRELYVQLIRPEEN